MAIESRGMTLSVSAMFLVNLAASHGKIAFHIYIALIHSTLILPGYLFNPPSRQLLAHDLPPRLDPEIDYCVYRSPNLVCSKQPCMARRDCMIENCPSNNVELRSPLHAGWSGVLRERRRRRQCASLSRQSTFRRAWYGSISDFCRRKRIVVWSLWYATAGKQQL